MAQKFERGTGPRSFRPAFNRGGRPGGRPSFGGRSDRPTTMHQATCSTCGKDCQVPFRPTGDKPVYCRDCFNKQGGADRGDRDRGERRDERPDVRRDFTPAPMRINPPTQANGESNAELKRQLEQVNVKLERLISAVQALTPMLAALKPIATEKSPVKKVVKKIAVKK